MITVTKQNRASTARRCMTVDNHHELLQKKRKEVAKLPLPNKTDRKTKALTARCFTMFSISLARSRELVATSVCDFKLSVAWNKITHRFWPCTKQVWLQEVEWFIRYMDKIRTHRFQYICNKEMNRLDKQTGTCKMKEWQEGWSGCSVYLKTVLCKCPWKPGWPISSPPCP